MQQDLVHDSGLRLGMKHALVVDDLDVSAEANDLLTDLSLESQDDADRENHHHETDGDAPSGDMDSGTGQTMTPRSQTKQASGYGEFK